ncbi:MAG: Glu-tRNA(Gln) amidotransferase subunit GatE [Candidatus Lokiarchaeota archaeon]|nr:Glu-tRNA(Gln) amidotransferase subunit GatE [Candidatus Lokiarchaeota archaeon]MBD3199313.1 Glu-tRNA(Gln) amidotransferase subunit GatE [Candidatus Lokiarchaeota archaeon]
MDEFDYKELGLKCGLEIHQQLNSETKLFCRCPNELQGTREPDFILRREMRPVLGEMGTYDKAMLTEYEKDLDIIYECYNDVICTYEIDETPPFMCNIEARKIAIKIGLLLNSNIIKEMHVCRKNYLDGSVPCGFQRTMILAKDGYVELENGKKIGIDILCLEEDAARRTETEKKEKTNFFRLDRLGIPLVEVTTKPDINDPDECRECAERLGLLLWSTNVKKVLGSIRQDINVSIKKGTRIEIKGVQKLDWIPLLINHEISRQYNLIQIKEQLTQKDLNKQESIGEIKDISNQLKETSCKFIAKGIKSGKKLYGLNIRGFNKIFGKELMENYRFGTEVSSKVKSISGLKGLIHSDENLKEYGFSEKDIGIIKNTLNVKKEDCFVLLLGKETEINKALHVIENRVKYAFEGVPPETRKALENGNTEFLRELHGGARLYPDTDSQPIINKDQEIQEITTHLPDYPWKIIKKYSTKFETEERVIKELIFSGYLELFETLLEYYPDNPTLIITSLLETATALRRDGKQIENITDEDYIEIFSLLKSKEIGKEAVEDLMVGKADNPELTIEAIKDNLNLESISKDELNDIINSIIDKNFNLLKEQKMRAMGPLMGDAMKQVRGKIDGAIVSKALKNALLEKIKELN